ncbi:hypothetical protein AC844P1_00021 [Anaerostipes phage AC844P1]|nr:hypothetical protein AC844P1_00021 [Anaerostipes phage AC844P1]WAX05291.1 hypothetical protein AC844P2_00021 [Anaerostipes phage AC844P2]WAX05350.1 hypothetical protein AC844P3_00021 [Anaerostipes phage AC844P3]
MANLYEIDEQIMQCIDEDTGEILDLEKLNHLQMQQEQKVESLALWYKNLLSDAAALKAEKETFAAREKSAKNRAESIKAYLSDFLNGEKFETKKAKITFRKSKQVDIIDQSTIDDDYLIYQEPRPNKTKIKEALKSGAQLKGVQLVEKKNIQIK